MVECISLSICDRLSRNVAGVVINISAELKMTDPIRIGIAGAGFAARFHMKGIRRVYGVPLTVTGVISNTPTSRQKFAQEFGIQAFDSLEEL
jgi:ornithine cyclodeaminase/alanine dehydrogenase-like protein (mu-crystallin family)